jgi:predicted RNA-binding Zn-ribbon protein involved in translation (DUF1610 family)|tara:strand:- start:464 stop:709 length:246 start_codon:yes stop_codon:yes gene_type:complete
MGKEFNMNDGKGLNITPDQLEDFVCEGCGNQTFVPVMIFKKLSAVYSPAGKDTMVPLQVFKCDECGKIAKEFLPKEAQTNE